MAIKDSAVCIRASDYSETSQIVLFFTKWYGKIGLIAKGSKRAKSSFDGPIEVLSIGEIVFTPAREHGLGTLTEYEQKYIGQGFVKSNTRMNCALLAAELIDAFTEEGDPHPELFDACMDFFERLTDADRRGAICEMILFELALLKEIGLLPIFDRCVNCKQAIGEGFAEVYFASNANGLVCRDCEMSFPGKIPVARDVAAILHDLRELSLAEEHVLLAFEKLLLNYFAYHHGRALKMAKYILSG